MEEAEEEVFEVERMPQERSNRMRYSDDDYEASDED